MNIDQADVALSPLNAADVGAIQTALKCKCLLREIVSEPLSSHPPAKVAQQFLLIHLGAEGGRLVAFRSTDYKSQQKLTKGRETGIASDGATMGGERNEKVIDQVANDRYYDGISHRVVRLVI